MIKARPPRAMSSGKLSALPPVVGASAGAAAPPTLLTEPVVEGAVVVVVAGVVVLVVVVLVVLLDDPLPLDDAQVSVSAPLLERLILTLLTMAHAFTVNDDVLATVS